MKLSYLFRTIHLAVLLLVVGNAYAETNRGSISGKVIDKVSGQPIPYVSVTLGQLPDTTIKKSAITDNQGSYSFAEVKEGRYVITAYTVGYGRKHSKPIACKYNMVTVEDLVLENTIIKEVTVNGRRPEIEQKADRTVMNIENSATASGENAYEVLRKAPGINIDKDDNISIKGKEGVMVTINDKPTYLSGVELASYLKALHGTEIEKIELITAPPARYEAAGNTGIINIKMKRNNKVGVNGTANAGVTITQKVGHNEGLSLNMRKGKVNTFGTFTYAKGYNRNVMLVDRKIDADTARILQNSIGTNEGDGINCRVGMDYELNKRHTFGILARGSKYNDLNIRNTNNDIFLRNGDIAKYLNSNDRESTHRKNYTLNANYRMNIDTNGRALNVDVDYVEYKNRGGQNDKTCYFKPNGESDAPDLLLRNRIPSDIYIKSFRIDYTHPLAKELILETGVKSSMVSSDNNLTYEKYNLTFNSWNDDIERSNHFKFDESILAGYTSLSYDKSGWSIKGGLRAEQTWNKGNSISIGRTTTRDYLNLFPTLFIQKTVNKNNVLGISYNRRIDRPNYRKLNPFVFRIDEYTYEEGNPYLKPQYTDNIEVNHAWRNMLFTSMRYSHTKDIQAKMVEEAEISKPSNGSTQTIKATKVSKRNLASLSSYMLNVNAILSPFVWFRSINNITAMYSEYSRGAQEANNSKLMYIIYSSNSFILPQKYIFEIMLKYNSAMVYGLNDLEPTYSLNIGLQKKFLSNRLSAKLSFDDVFNSYKIRARVKYDNINLFNREANSTQRINLSLTYRFGSNDVKQVRQRSTSSEEEMNRTGK
jgi:5-hydroxyisourate hydrolase-like protein (transthyretin family)